MIVTAGKTNVSVYFYVVGDAGHATPGEPVTGLLFSDIETGGSASYMRQGAARVDLTLVTIASASTAHADGSFILVDDTNMPGVYRCDFPDLAFATGVDQVVCQIVIAAANNAVAAPILVDITDVDLRDTVRAGLTALPNAVVEAAGGLIVSTAGTTDADDCLTATGFATPTNITSASGIVLSGVTHTGAVIPVTTTLTNTASADVVSWLGTAAATPTTAGVPEVDLTFVNGVAWSLSTAQFGANVVNWSGTAAATPDTAGYPVVTVKDGTGTGELQTASGVVDANVAQILGNVAAATNLSASARSMAILTVNTGNTAATTTTASFTGSSEATADHFIGRKLFFYDSGDALFLQGTSITDSSWDAGNSEVLLTFQQLTDTPSDADLAVLV